MWIKKRPPLWGWLGTNPWSLLSPDGPGAGDLTLDHPVRRTGGVVVLDGPWVGRRLVLVGAGPALLAGPVDAVAVLLTMPTATRLLALPD